MKRMIVPALRKTVPFIPVRPLSRPELISTLPHPVRHPAIPENAKWLSGEGAGSWFTFEFEEPFLKATKYSPDGRIECMGMYEGPVKELREMNYSIDLDYLSTCKDINLKMNGERLRFSRIHTDSLNDIFSSKMAAQPLQEPILKVHF